MVGALSPADSLAGGVVQFRQQLVGGFLHFEVVVLRGPLLGWIKAALFTTEKSPKGKP
jgi:hypothetical protein